MIYSHFERDLLIFHREIRYRSELRHIDQLRKLKSTEMYLEPRCLSDAF